MKFGAIFRYELSYRFRAPSTWFYFVLGWIGPLVIVHTSSTANNRVINAPLHYAEIVNILSFFAMVVTAHLFGEPASRDAATGMQPLFNTAPISKWDYLGGRFAAAFLVNLLILMGMPLAVAASTQLPWLSHFNWAPFQIQAFLQPLILFTLPNLLISGAIIYTIATLTKNQLATYLGALCIAIMYLIVVNEGLWNEVAERLLDPFGIGVVEDLVRYWTPAEQVTRLLGFWKWLVWNRLLWMGFSAALLAFLYYKFDFTHPGLRGRKRTTRTGAEADEPLRHAIATVPSARRAFDARGRLAQLLAVTRHSISDITRNWLFLIMVLVAVFVMFAFGWEVGAVVFETSTWPVTHLMGDVMSIALRPVFTVLILLVAGELVWKERDVGVGDIAAATPVPDWIPIVGRFIALAVILVILLSVMMVAGMALQTVQGYYRYEPLLYVKLLSLNLLIYLIFAALAMAVHVVVNQKAVGHSVLVAIYLFTLIANLLGIRHLLLIYGAAPGWIYSDLNKFGPFLAPFFWFKAYWGAWALMFAVVATAFWVRGTEVGWRARMLLFNARMRGGLLKPAIVASVLIVLLGGFVFYNTNVLHDYITPKKGVARRVAYERLYKRFANAPQPTVVADSMLAEVYPERSQAEVSGAFTVVNLTTQRIDSIHVSLSSAVTTRALGFSTSARLALSDTVFRHRIYVLDRPMQPGDTMRMTYDVEFAPRGFTNDRAPTQVVHNGAYFDRTWLPFFGYQSSRELTDEKERKKQGLPPQSEPPSARDTTRAARDARVQRPVVVDMNVVIGTAENQIAVTPGRLVREWRENGRRYFQYVTDAPVTHGAPVLSAEYALREGKWQDVPLRIYYHPTHTFNLDRIMLSMQKSLGYYTSQFGPYPYHELRVVEFPRYASFARAHPHTIAFSEGNSFITRIDPDSKVDRPFFVVAHETAHQWWGNALRGARMKGGALLSETLAQYSAVMVMESTYGVDMARQFYAFERDRYLRGRRSFTSREVPLVDAFDESNLYYNKGAVAMYTLREFIGADAVNLALRRFYMKYAGLRAPYPTSLDLLRELRAVTPDSLQPMVTDLFEAITLHELKTDSATMQRVGDTWHVSVTFTAKKLVADSIGKETEAPMHDLVELGIFGPPSNCRCGKQLYVGRHWVKSGTQTITIVVPATAGDSVPPAFARIDPYDKLIEREWKSGVAISRP